MDLLDLVRQVSTDKELGSSSAATVSGSCFYYHYCCDGIDDKVVLDFKLLQFSTIKLLISELGLWLSYPAVVVFLGRETSCHVHLCTWCT